MAQRQRRHHPISICTCEDDLPDIPQQWRSTTVGRTTEGQAPFSRISNVSLVDKNTLEKPPPIFSKIRGLKFFSPNTPKMMASSHDPKGLPSTRERGDSGFSLIELMVSLMVFGLLLSASLPVYRAQKWAHSLQVTRAHQEQILYALAAFVQHNGRLPCPADPKGDGYERVRCQSPILAQGILPFATLGLSQRIAQDGQHRLFSYGVHPQLTLTESTQEFCCRPLKHLLFKNPPNGQPFDPFALFLIQSSKSGDPNPPCVGTLDRHPVFGDTQGNDLWLPRQFFDAFYGRLFCSELASKNGVAIGSRDKESYGDEGSKRPSSLDWQ